MSGLPKRIIDIWVNGSIATRADRSGEKQVDIAQMKEVVNVLPQAFSQFSDSQIIKFIRGVK